MWLLENQNSYHNLQHLHGLASGNTSSLFHTMLPPTPSSVPVTLASFRPSNKRLLDRKPLFVIFLISAQYSLLSKAPLTASWVKSHSALYHFISLTKAAILPMFNRELSPPQDLSIFVPLAHIRRLINIYLIKL